MNNGVQRISSETTKTIRNKLTIEERVRLRKYKKKNEEKEQSENSLNRQNNQKNFSVQN